MHEMPLAEGILEVALQAAGDRPVRRVRVRAGALQRVVPDSLQFCFELVAAGTPAADAHLLIELVPARLRCRRCNTETEQVSPPFLCGACGDPDVEYVSGEELMVDGVELDTGWRLRPGVEADSVADRVPPGHLEEHSRAELAAHASRVSFGSRARRSQNDTHRHDLNHDEALHRDPIHRDPAHLDSLHRDPLQFARRERA